MPKIEGYQPLSFIPNISQVGIGLRELDDSVAYYQVVRRHGEIGRTGRGEEEMLRFFGRNFKFRVDSDFSDPNIHYLIREGLSGSRSGEPKGFDAVELVIYTGDINTEGNIFLIQKKTKRRRDVLGTDIDTYYFLRATQPENVAIASRYGPFAWRYEDDFTSHDFGRPGLWLGEREYTISYEGDGQIRVIPKSAEKFHQRREYLIKPPAERNDYLREIGVFF